VICAKGFETASGERLSQVAASERPDNPIAVLSGPNFAREVALGLPAAATLGATDAALGQELAEALSSTSFRLYWTDDVTGVEVGGAVKNVLAVAAGIVIGRGLGENARAALITRGLAELARLGAALGARRETLMGLAGLGDLVLTASSLTSRNMAFGHAIGRGADPQALQAHPGALVEGAFTAAAVVQLAGRHGVEVPICAAVDAILAGRLDIASALEALMSRPIRTEAEP
jgi:glycerol-3-phosphate dehydrogenase (NAD(P)+)